MPRRKLLLSLSSLVLLPLMAHAEPGYNFPNTTPERAEWFRSQQNQRHGQCCGDESKDGHPLNSEEWRQVAKPFWDNENIAEPTETPDPRGDYYVQYQVKINGKWWNVHNWQVVDPKRAKGAGQYIHGSAEVWYNMSGPMGTPEIFCFLPGTLV